MRPSDRNPGIPLSRRSFSASAMGALAAASFGCGDAPVGALLEDPVLRVEAGQPVPDIVLPSLADGSPASLAQFRGKKVLLHVFASW